ncbi:ABCG1 [Symbiodinium pilosum]|uniref:ABCG1 protein n=1 Tax=Symbiodinium pilosum TaxID=2952 RepID=A0A812RFI6_SYMPI|nr:ABCG1 [Symbiodinium pilosum]
MSLNTTIAIVFVLRADALLASVGLALLGSEALLFGLYGSAVANDATERALLVAGAGATVVGAAIVGGLHESLSGMTAFPGQDEPMNVTA